MSAETSPNQVPLPEVERLPRDDEFPPVLPSQKAAAQSKSSASNNGDGSSFDDDDEPEERYVEEEVDLDTLPFWERPYYWQFVGVDMATIPRWQKAWHYSRWVGGKVFFGMEFVGEIVAELLGMNQSRYQWVIDTMAEDERRARRKKEIQARRDEMIQDGLLEVATKESEEAEGGLVDASDDDAAAAAEGGATAGGNEEGEGA
jgi:hypothetical protein